MRDERRKDGGRSEAGRREVGGRSEEFQLNWHLKGIQNPEFWSAGLRNLEFRSYLSEKIIKGFQIYFLIFALQKYK
jgi:hypothetical protein